MAAKSNLNFIFIFTTVSVVGAFSDSVQKNSTVEIPLVNNLNAPLIAQLDISDFTRQIKTLIEQEVEDAMISNKKQILLENELKLLQQTHIELKRENLQLKLNFSRIQNKSLELEEVSTLNGNVSEENAVELQTLKRKFKTLQQNFNELKEENILLKNNYRRIENKLLELSDLKRNMEFQMLQTICKTVQQNLNDTKQEIILLNLYYTRIHNESLELEKDVSTLKQDVSEINTVKLQKLENVSKVNMLELHRLEILSKRAMFSSWPPEEVTTSAGNIIPFTNVQTSHGINDLSSVKNDGVFTCEQNGIYLITFFVGTKTSSAKMALMKDSTTIARANKHGQEDYTTHTAIVLYKLTVGDRVFVKAEGSLNVWHMYDSIFTVLQVQ